MAADSTDNGAKHAPFTFLKVEADFRGITKFIGIVGACPYLYTNNRCNGDSDTVFVGVETL